jgi:hypothetical protein
MGWLVNNEWHRVCNKAVVTSSEAMSRNWPGDTEENYDKHRITRLRAEIWTLDLFNKKFWEELIAHFPCYDTGHIENDVSNNSSIVACAFVTTVTILTSRCLATIGAFLPSRCLATIRGFLPSRCLATTRLLLPSRCRATITEFYRTVA